MRGGFRLPGRSADPEAQRNFEALEQELSRVVRGSDSQTADGSATSFEIKHGLGVTPKTVQVTPGSTDAGGFTHVTVDSDTITVHYGAAPSASASLVWYWTAIAAE